MVLDGCTLYNARLQIDMVLYNRVLKPIIIMVPQLAQMNGALHHASAAGPCREMQIPDQSTDCGYLRGCRKS
jgi:hypothetical protein